MKARNQVRIFQVLAAVVLSGVGQSSAQQVTGVPGTPNATTTINGEYLPNPPSQFRGTINPGAPESKPYWPPQIVPPKGRRTFC